MEIIPVIDIYRQQVVHAIAGNRDQYQPLKSNLTTSLEPLEVARAVRDRFGFEKIYVADLDGIRDRNPNLDVIYELHRDGFHIVIDIGLADGNGIHRLIERNRELEDASSIEWVIGLESMESFESLRECATIAGANELVFSLDMKNGQPLTQLREWLRETPLNIAKEVVQLGFRNLIVLDLAGVGVSQGCPTLELCREIRSYCQRNDVGVNIITGGGIRHQKDIDQLQHAGVNSVLVSTALHNGALGD